MGAVSRNVYNFQLMALADYTNKRLLKKMIGNYHNLKELAGCGDTVAASIFVDLKSAINSDYLTKVQKDCVIAVLISKQTYSEVASDRGRKESSVVDAVNRGVANIQKALMEGKLYDRKSGNDS